MLGDSALPPLQLVVTVPAHTATAIVDGMHDAGCDTPDQVQLAMLDFVTVTIKVLGGGPVVACDPARGGIYHITNVPYRLSPRSAEQWATAARRGRTLPRVLELHVGRGVLPSSYSQSGAPLHLGVIVGEEEEYVAPAVLVVLPASRRGEMN